MGRLCHPLCLPLQPGAPSPHSWGGLPSPPHQDSSTRDQHSECHEPVSAALSTVHVF